MLGVSGHNFFGWAYISSLGIQQKQRKIREEMVKIILNFS